MKLGYSFSIGIAIGIGIKTEWQSLNSTPIPKNQWNSDDSDSRHYRYRKSGWAGVESSGLLVLQKIPMTIKRSGQKAARTASGTRSFINDWGE